MYYQPKYTPNKNIRYQLSSDELKLKVHLETQMKAMLQQYYGGLVNNRMFAGE